MTEQEALEKETKQRLHNWRMKVFAWGWSWYGAMSTAISFLADPDKGWWMPFCTAIFVVIAFKCFNAVKEAKLTLVVVEK